MQYGIHHFSKFQEKSKIWCFFLHSLQTKNGQIEVFFRRTRGKIPKNKYLSTQLCVCSHGQISTDPYNYPFSLSEKQTCSFNNFVKNNYTYNNSVHFPIGQPNSPDYQNKNTNGYKIVKTITRPAH